MDEPKTFREKSGVERSAGRAESAGIPTIFVSHSGTYKRLVIVLRTRRTKAIEDLSGGDLPRLHLFTYFYCHTANMQCLSILVTGSKGPRSFCFVVSYETFYPNSAYTLPGLQMGTDKLLRSPDEMQGMGAFLGILDPRKKSSAGWARANFLNSSWLSSITSRNRIRSGSQLNQSWMQTATFFCGVCESLSQPFLEMSRNASLENALKNGCEKDWA